VNHTAEGEHQTERVEHPAKEDAAAGQLVHSECNRRKGANKIDEG
jgi:hypothetical protein